MSDDVTCFVRTSTGVREADLVIGTGGRILKSRDASWALHGVPETEAEFREAWTRLLDQVEATDFGFGDMAAVLDEMQRTAAERLKQLRDHHGEVSGEFDLF